MTSFEQGASRLKLSGQTEVEYRHALEEIVGVYNHAISFEGGKPAGLGAGEAFAMADLARKALDLPELRSL